MRELRDETSVLFFLSVQGNKCDLQTTLCVLRLLSNLAYFAVSGEDNKSRNFLSASGLVPDSIGTPTKDSLRGYDDSFLTHLDPVIWCPALDRLPKTR